MRSSVISVLFLIFSIGPDLLAQNSTTPPRPHLPIPTARQLDWQRSELSLFLHFGMNTFTNREWGMGNEDPKLFAPAKFSPRQWTRVAREAGFKAVILTAKHHDGFSLWPSRYTDHDVSSSRWMNGNGDVVRALVEAASQDGMRVGLYLSPWDMHEPTYGDNDGYNRFYMGQLRELLSNYGPLAEVWFDGAKGEDAKDMAYDFDAYWSLVRQLQPNAVLFSDAGPDVRWIGNEHGFAGETNWSTYDRSKVGIGMHGIQDYLNTGEAEAPDWVPGECDVSIREGWFYHPDQKPKSLEELMEIYFKSVGRNCVLLLNVPPNPDGRLDDADVSRLRELKAVVEQIFAVDLASDASATSSDVRGGSSEYDPSKVLDGSLDTFWAGSPGKQTGTVELELNGEKTFDVIRLQEPIQLGQRVAAYRIEAWHGGTWNEITKGTTIGHKKLDRLPRPVTTHRVRFVIEKALAEPLIAEIGLHLYNEQ